MIINIRNHRENKSRLCLVVVSWFVVLSGSFFLDTAAASLMNVIRTPALTRAMETITFFGDARVLVLVVGCLYIIGRAGEPARRTAVVAALALLTTGLCVLVLKVLMARGNDGDFHFFWNWYPRAMLFPSGHAALVCAVWVVIWQAYRAIRWPLFAIALTVAVSRVYLVHHFFSDVVAGLLLGFAVGSLVQRYANKWSCLQPQSRGKIAYDT